jgi:hypothetical protein
LKNSKDKPVVLVCNKNNSDGDIFVAYADAAVHGQFNLGGPAEEGAGKALFHQFFAVNGVATKVSNMLQSLVPGATGAYSQHTVAELDDHDGISSHSIKHGSIEEMEANGVHSGNCTDLSGHAPSSDTQAKTGSAFDKYHRASNARVAVGKFSACPSVAPVPPTSHYNVSLCSCDGPQPLATTPSWCSRSCAESRLHCVPAEHRLTRPER